MPRCKIINIKENSPTVEEALKKFIKEIKKAANNPLVNELPTALFR